MVHEENGHSKFAIDNDAKARVMLDKLIDGNGNPYYVGKLQAPFDWNFTHGSSFMVFISDEGHEELQIGPVNWDRYAIKPQKKRKNGEITSDGKITIKLRPSTDRDGKPFYVGELVIPNAFISLAKGVFFSIFVSREGNEEIQIGPLDHSRKKKLMEQKASGEYKLEQHAT